MGKTSHYKGVVFSIRKLHGRDYPKWQASCRLSDNKRWNSYHDTEREAAIAYDKKRIELGKDPVNVLKPKTK